jgi:hypothetical protein
LKARSVVIAVVLVLALACSLAYESCAQNPLRHSEADVRAWLLQKTPIGSTREQVMATIVREHWSGHREYRGTFRREIEHHPYFAHGAELGTYRAFFRRCSSGLVMRRLTGFSERMTGLPKSSPASGAKVYESPGRKCLTNR